MITTAITGAGSGIGAGVRVHLEGLGHRIIGVDLKNAEIIADLSAPDGRRQAIEEIAAACDGTLDHLVTCAGLGGHVDPKSLVASVNYFGSIEVIDGLLPVLEKGSNPAVAAIVSNSAQIAPLDDHPFVTALLDHDEREACRLIDELGSGPIAYMGTKHALGRAIRRRVRKWGDARVRLNGVCPGPVKTPLLQASMDDPSTADAVKSIDIPIGRWGEPEDVARLVAFLLSPEASWIHGSLLFVDGGNDAEIRPDRY
jgi:NAD(P)-dependent dehydrogenase (short-subunit alcohol dehydrogenase family)